MSFQTGLPTPQRNFSLHYVAVLANWAQDHGCSLAQLLEGTELVPEELQVMGQYTTNQAFPQLISNAYRHTGIEALGIEFGSLLNISSHTALGHAVMNCSNFGHVMEVFLKYYRIVTSDVLVRASKDENNFHTTLKVTDVEQLPLHFTVEVCFAAIYTSARFLLQRQDLPFTLELAYQPPAYEEHYYRFFGEQVRFGCKENRLVFPLALNDQELPSANAALLSMYEQQCALQLKNIEGEDKSSDKVRFLLEKMDGHYPSFEQIADMLAQSPRTLRRRLEAEGVRYSAILEGVRRDHAIELLTHSSMSLSSIAYRLGYNDVSNFRRAFIQWTGKAPMKYRDGKD